MEIFQKSLLNTLFLHSNNCKHLRSTILTCQSFFEVYIEFGSTFTLPFKNYIENIIHHFNCGYDANLARIV